MLNVLSMQNNDLLSIKNKLHDYYAKRNVIKDVYFDYDSTIIDSEINFVNENIKILKEKYLNIEISKILKFDIKFSINNNDYFIENNYILIILSDNWPVNKPSYYIKYLKDNMNVNYLTAIEIIYKKLPNMKEILDYLCDSLSEKKNYDLHDSIHVLYYLCNLFNRIF